MEAHNVALSRWDLVKYNLFVLPRVTSYIRWVLFSWAAVVLFDWSSSSNVAGYNLGWEHVLSLLPTGLMVFAFWYVAMLTFVIVTAGSNGLVGNTDYFVEDAGFRYVTSSTDSLTYWHSVGEPKVVGGMLYVPLSSYVFCLLPARGFASTKDFDAFRKAVLDHQRAAN